MNVADGYAKDLLPSARMIVYPRKPGSMFTLTHIEGKIR